MDSTACPASVMPRLLAYSVIMRCWASVRQTGMLRSGIRARGRGRVLI